MQSRGKGDKAGELASGGLACWFHCRYRQEDPEGASIVGLAVDAYGPTVRLDDAQRCGETQPAAREFGGEKRIEDSRPCRFVHSATVVLNFHQDVLSEFDIGVH